MLFLESDLALFKRLTGAPLDSRGRPLLDGVTHLPANHSRVIHPSLGGGKGPSYGLRIPMLKTPYDEKHGLTSQDPDALRMFLKGFEPGSFRQVPVFDENIEGRKWEDVWPCVTFRWTNTQLHLQDGQYPYDDPFTLQDSTAATANITNRDGDVIQSGKQARTLVPQPEPWDITYQLRVYSKSPVEVSLICGQLMYLLPGRGGLEIEYANGESHVCDFLFESMVNLDTYGDDVPMTLGMDEERYYCRAFNYRLESFFDNTTNQFGTDDIQQRKVILQRYFEIATLRDVALSHGSWDANKSELEPLPPPRP